MPKKSQKKIILGVTGSIAAYKAAILLRILIKEGYSVRVVMTESAKDFVSPLTFSVISKKEVIQDFKNADQWNNHIDLAHWADLILIYPATCQTIAKLSNGFCDNILLGICLSAKCPIVLSPSMDADMWNHASVKENIRKLQLMKMHVLDVEEGELASGKFGPGRLLQPKKAMKALNPILQKDLIVKTKLKNKKVVITLGATYEPIDSVRFIGNLSSGKMGKALIDELTLHSVDLTIIHGFVEVKFNPIQYKKIIFTPTADKMLNACKKEFTNADVLIMVAAVADFVPAKTENKKIKKQKFPLELKLIPTKDILKELGKVKTNQQTLIGFSLEDGTDALENAKQKLQEKKLDAIVLNNLKEVGVAFGAEKSKVTFISKSGIVQKFPLQNKSIIAKEIINSIEKLL